MNLSIRLCRGLRPTSWIAIAASRSLSSSSSGGALIAEESYSNNTIRRLVLNDPKTRNSLSLSMLEQIRDKLDPWSRDDNVRAIILAAAPPIFSAGHNLKELTFKEQGTPHHAKIFETCTHVMELIQGCTVPVICEVNGLAAAAGCQLVATCDIVLATDQSTFSTPGARVAGLFCSTPGVALGRAVPNKVAMDMLLTGEPIDAQTALRSGLISRIVAEDKLSSEALRIAEVISALSKPVMALGKAFYYAQMQMDRANAYKHGQAVMIENIRLEDCQEGIASFIEKRKPHWTHSAVRAC